MTLTFDDGPGYHGPLRRKPLEPLQIIGLVITLAMHVGIVVFVAKDAGASKHDKGPELNVMVTKLVRKGKPRDAKLLPQRYVAPKPTAPVAGPALTENVLAPAAKKEKKRDREADPDKVLRERMQRLRSQSNQPPSDPSVQPEGSLTGSEAGTASSGSEGDPCATAIHNVMRENWKVPELVKQSELSRLTARMRVRLNGDGSLTDPKIVTRSRNSYFDNSLLEVIERSGKSSETKSIISKDCRKAMNVTLRFVGADLK